MIESVHSEKLASAIGKISCERGIVTDILLEVNIGNEESKSGFSPFEILGGQTLLLRLCLEQPAETTP